MESGRRYVSRGAISDTIVYSKAISAAYSKHIISISFYADDSYSSLVSKSDMTGIVTFTATNSDSTTPGVDEEYGSVDSEDDGVLTLGSTTYERPTVDAQISRVKAVFSAITGATHYKLIIGSNLG